MTRPWMPLRTLPNPKIRICLTAFGAALALSLGSCAQKEPVSFSEVEAEYKSSLIEDKERVIINFHQACNPATGESEEPDPKDQCIVQRGILQTATDAMAHLNDTVDALVDAHNDRVRALIQCEYGERQRDRTIEYQDDQAFRDEIIAAGKQIVLGGVCGLLLLQ